MAQFPLNPRYSKILTLAAQHDLMDYAIFIVAGLSIQEIFDEQSELPSPENNQNLAFIKRCLVGKVSKAWDTPFSYSKYCLWKILGYIDPLGRCHGYLESYRSMAYRQRSYEFLPKAQAPRKSSKRNKETSCSTQKWRWAREILQQINSNCVYFQSIQFVLVWTYALVVSLIHLLMSKQSFYVKSFSLAILTKLQGEWTYMCLKFLAAFWWIFQFSTDWNPISILLAKIKGKRGILIR